MANSYVVKYQHELKQLRALYIKTHKYLSIAGSFFSSPFFKAPTYGDDASAEESVESPAFPSEIHPSHPGSFSALGSMLDGKSPLIYSFFVTHTKSIYRTWWIFWHNLKYNIQ